MRRGGWWLTVGIMGVAVVLIGTRLAQHLSYNVTAVSVIQQLEPVQARCKPLDPEWVWSDNAVQMQAGNYVNVVLASLGTKDSVSETTAQHDPRLVAWFQGLRLMRTGQEEQSLSYLRAAGAGRLLLAAGHATYLSDPACTVFDWVLAHDIGSVGPTPDPPLANLNSYVAGLIDNGQPEVVVDAYTRLLKFEPQKSDWRLTLARAHLALDQLPEAEEVLQPVLEIPSDRTKAEALLQAYRATQP